MKSATRESHCTEVWFMELERAKASHNFKRAAEVQQRLEELGVRVEYIDMHPNREVANDTHDN